MKRRGFLRVFVGTTVAFVSCTKLEAGTREQVPRYLPFKLPVGIANAADTELIAAAKSLNTFLGNDIDIVRAEANPLCCLWISQEHNPNPAIEGYLITIHPGGGEITATSRTQLLEAISQLRTVTRIDTNGVVEIPVGVITNFPVITTR